MSIFEQNPTSLKAFKECLQVGQKIRLVHSNIPGHVTVNLLREVVRKQSNDLVLKLLEGERSGRETYMSWPKASGLRLLRDERGFYGFTIAYDDKHADALTYHFEPENGKRA